MFRQIAPQCTLSSHLVHTISPVTRCPGPPGPPKTVHLASIWVCSLFVSTSGPTRAARRPMLSDVAGGHCGHPLRCTRQGGDQAPAQARPGEAEEQGANWSLAVTRLRFKPAANDEPLRLASGSAHRAQVRWDPAPDSASSNGGAACRRFSLRPRHAVISAGKSPLNGV